MSDVQRFWTRDSFWGVAGGLVALVFFVGRTARELVLFGDSAELIAAAKVWGVPHPTGYPLWTLLGHAASRLGFGSVAFRVNLTSALAHAIAVGFVMALAFRLRGPVAALAAGAALALGGSFLLGSTYAEVFPLNDALFAISLYLVVRARRPGRFSAVVLAFAVFGLSLGHHHMALLGLPALAILVAGPVRESVRGRPLRIAALIAAALIPFLFSVGLLWIAARRDTLVSYGDVHDLGSLLRLLTRTDYGGVWSASRHPSPEPSSGRIGAFALIAYRGMGPLVLGFALVGTLALTRSDKRLLAALTLAAIMAGPLFAALNRVRVDDEAGLAFFERFTTMADVPIALLAGIGAAALAAAIPSALPGRRWLGVLCGLLPGLALLPKASAVQPRRDRIAPAFARDLVAGVPDGSLVLISGDLYTGAMQYACAVENACGRITLFAPGQMFLPWKLAALKRRHSDVDLPEGKIGLASTHEIVERALAHRAVFVMPSLLLRDEAMSHEFAFVPSRLLLRVVKEPADAKKLREPFLALARALADGKECSGCASDPRDVYRPSRHVEILEAYSTMYENHARYAAQVGDRELARALLRRARTLDRIVMQK
jgi:Protein O-mannosyl-transferase TMEM260-like